MIEPVGDIISTVELMLWRNHLLELFYDETLSDLRFAHK